MAEKGTNQTSPVQASGKPAGVDTSVSTRVSLLFVEDLAVDVQPLVAAFSDFLRAKVRVVEARTLNAALARIDEERFDLILLALELPDSRGVDTFARVHARAQQVPILVLTSSDDDSEGKAAVQHGALDYLKKSEATPTWLGRCVRYAVERSALERELREARERERRMTELEGMGRLSSVNTEVTSQLYSGVPLRQSAPTVFARAVDDYEQALDHALEQRIHRGESERSQALQDISDALCFMRAGPRDVVDIHVSALRNRFADAKPEKANALLEEGRIVLLELMGNLVSHYRPYYTPSQQQRAPQ